MLTVKEFKKDVSDIVNFSKKISSLYDNFNKLFGNFDGKVSDLISDLLEKNIELVEEKYDCKEDIGWFIFDNDYGKNGYEISIDGIGFEINTIEDLWNVITEEKYGGEEKTSK